MPVVVQVPALLRRFTGGQDEISVDGATLGEVLGELGRGRAELLAHLLDRGEIRSLLHVFVNGSDARGAGGLQTPVRDGDEVDIIPMIAGGR